MSSRIFTPEISLVLWLSPPLLLGGLGDDAAWPRGAVGMDAAPAGAGAQELMLQASATTSGGGRKRREAPRSVLCAIAFITTPPEWLTVQIMAFRRLFN